METILVHPNGINELKVSPMNVKGLLKLGWKVKTGATAEVIEFSKNKTLEFIEKKKTEPEKDCGKDCTCKECETKPAEPIKEPVVKVEPEAPAKVFPAKEAVNVQKTGTSNTVRKGGRPKGKGGK
jgi:hypothetical protein